MQIIDATQAHIARFLVSITKEDVIEFRKLMKVPEGEMAIPYLQERLQELHKNPDSALVAMVSGKTVYALGGFDMTGQVWFMTTTYAVEKPKEFVQSIRSFTKLMFEQGFQVLHNMMWTGNKAHEKFLNLIGVRWLGPVKSHPEFNRFVITEETFKCVDR